MTTDILIAIILFGVTLAAYCLFMPVRLFGGRLGPGLIRGLVIAILVNCACQVYLLLNGHITCSIIFVALNALEALVIGLITESAFGLAQKIFAKKEELERWMKDYPREQGNVILPDGMHFHNKVDLTHIANSMQLDSDQVVAELENDAFSVTLEVCGKVRVIWNPDPNGKAEDGEVYRTPSQFPDSLMEVFAKRMNTAEMPNIYVDDNNWFEIRVEDKKTKKTVYSDYFDAEELSPEEVKVYLLEEMKQWQA